MRAKLTVQQRRWSCFLAESVFVSLGIKPTALTYALGLTIVQCYWVSLLFADFESDIALYSLFILGALFELAVPAAAERKATTPWHKHHIVERYGLLNIIVLGEALLAVSFAIKSADKTGFESELIRLCVSSMIITYCLWWLYFSNDEPIEDRRISRVFTWAYGHFFIYMSGAAVGAGLAAYVDVLSNSLPMNDVVIRTLIAIPISVYLMGLNFSQVPAYSQPGTRSPKLTLINISDITPLKPRADKLLLSSHFQ